ncbi:MAG: hypothetical protein PHQ19_03295 [Candidatus Krumholzibacteria bacterium]|nr:hypothetical protein [Candidatus Krumholzibacteria bacterium]
MRTAMKVGKCNFRLVAALCAATLIAASCSEDAGTGEQIVLTQISPFSAGAGDTVTVSGRGFGADPAAYRVAFSPVGYSKDEGSRCAAPFEISGSTARVVVPEGSYNGEVRFESAAPFGGGIFGVGAPRIPSNELDVEIPLGAGEAAKLFCASIDYSFPLSYGTALDEYVLIAFDSSVPITAGMTTDYRVDTDDPCDAKDASERPEIPSTGRLDRVRAAVADPGPFDRRKREEIARVLSAGAPAGDGGQARYSRAGSGAAPPTAQFNVYGDIEGSTIDPESYTTVTANWAYEGEHTVLYLDASTHPTCITDLELQQLGGLFEYQIYETNTAAFGSPSDINNDGKVVILLTPVVNLLTPPGGAGEGFIAGFFMPGDLLPGLLPSGTSNGMEIYYSMVPDPNGIYGNTYEKPRALDVISGVMAHEFQHMIMFNYRVLIYGSGISAAYMAELWVDEGLAHIAEDLNGFDESNIGRADLFLADPGKATLIHGGDALDERGASFLFFRYIGDRFGEDIYRRIVQSKKTGTANIESATGVGFKELFADWAATLYFESRGVAPADPKYRYTSIDLAGDFAPLRVRSTNLCAGPFMGAVESMGPEFIALGLGGPALFDIDLTCSGYGRMNAVLLRTQ